MLTFQHKQKKIFICVLMKSLKSLHTNEAIYWTKGLNLLTSVDTKKSSPFDGMIARTRNSVFIKIFLAVFPLETPVCPARLMFCIIWICKQNLSGSNRGFHWDISWWCHLFVWILLHSNFFVLRYYFLSQDCCKLWNV